MSYGAVEDDVMADMKQYYQEPQPRKPHSHNKFSRQSSNAASFEMTLDTSAPASDLRMKSQLEQRLHSNNEFDMHIAAEPRDIYKANHISSQQKASQKLTCIWIGIILLFILTCTAATCIDQHVINIYGHSSQSGFYFWTFGWTNSIFHPGDTALIEDQVPLKFVQRYAVDAGRFFIVSALIIIACLLFSMIILCARCTNEVYLYILCCGIRIPQAPTLYILLSTIKHYSRSAIYLYLFVILYGMLEMNFYANFACPVLGGACTNFGVPHYGAAAFVLIGVVINCFVMKRVVRLDKAFNNKTIQYFYPDHVRRINTRACMNIRLDYLKAAIHCIRIVIICASVMLIAFHNSGLILIGDWDKSTQSFSLFFQFQGLLNDKVAIEGEKYTDLSAAGNFVSICWIFYSILLPFILIFNALTLFYLYYVIVTFHAIGCCKFIIVIIAFVEWLSFTIVSAVYYYAFHVFWKDYLKYNSEKTEFYNEENEYALFWCPDWGIILIVIIDWYILKLIVFTFKSM